MQSVPSFLNISILRIHGQGGEGRGARGRGTVLSRNYMVLFATSLTLKMSKKKFFFWFFYYWT